MHADSYKIDDYIAKKISSQVVEAIKKEKGYDSSLSHFLWKYNKSILHEGKVIDSYSYVQGKFFVDEYGDIIAKDYSSVGFYVDVETGEVYKKSYGDLSFKQNAKWDRDYKIHGIYFSHKNTKFEFLPWAYNNGNSLICDVELSIFDLKKKQTIMFHLGGHSVPQMIRYGILVLLRRMVEMIQMAIIPSTMVIGLIWSVKYLRRLLIFRNRL